MKKRLFSMLLTAAMIASTLTVPAFAAPFGDTDGHWGQKAIERWSDHNIVNGADGMFRPDDCLTRGELATIVANLLKLTEMPAGNPFSDLDQNWYTNAILKCYEAGIMSGDGATVRPNDPVTREEAMVILSNALRIAPKEGEVEGFADSHHVSDWAEGAVNALLHSGIVSGIGGDMLAPQGLINRASVVTILNNAIGNYVSEDGTTIEAKGGMVLVVGGDVTVTGEADSVVVLGGEKEVVLKDLEVKGDVVVEGADTKIVLSGETEVDKVTVAENATGAAVEVGADASAGEVAVEAPKAEVTVAGKADSVTVKGEETKVEVSGKVDVVAVGEAATDTEVTVTEDAKVDTLATDAANTDVLVQGKVSDVKVGEAAAETTVKVESTGEIETVETKAEDVSVSGKGEVGKVEASGDNTAVTTPDTKVEAAEGTSGVTAGDNKVEGGETATTTPEKEESSSSSSSSHSHRYSTIWVDEETGVEYKKCSCGRKVATGNEYEAKAGSKYFATLEEAVVAGGDVKLLKDAELDAEVPALVITSTMTVDLNGKTITVPNDISGDGVFWVKEGGKLTIEGDGTVNGAADGNEYDMVVWADGGEVIINGGTYTNVSDDKTGTNDKLNNNEVIYVKNGGKATINGGTFIGNNPKFTLNSHDTLKGTIVVYGGEFYQYNPAKSYTEPAPQPWNFVAEGYTTKADGDYYVVEKAVLTGAGTEEEPYQIWDEEGYLELLGEEGVLGDDTLETTTYIVLKADLDMAGEDIPLTHLYNVQFDGNNKTIENLETGLFGAWSYYYGENKISNLRIEDGENNYSMLGYGPYYSNAENKLTVDNVYIVNCDCAGGAFAFYSGSAKVVIKNSTVDADTVITAPSSGMAGGGFIGNGQNFEIDGCTMFGTVKGTNGHIAGFVGQGAWDADKTAVKNSTMDGTLMQYKTDGTVFVVAGGTPAMDDVTYDAAEVWVKSGATVTVTSTVTNHGLTLKTISAIENTDVEIEDGVVVLKNALTDVASLKTIQHVLYNRVDGEGKEWPHYNRIMLSEETTTVEAGTELLTTVTGIKQVVESVDNIPDGDGRRYNMITDATNAGEVADDGYYYFNTQLDAGYDYVALNNADTAMLTQVVVTAYDANDEVCGSVVIDVPYSVEVTE